MRNLSASLGREKEGWQDRPSTCLTEAELWFAANGSWVISSGLALIVLAIINARRISKMASEWSPRLALSLVGYRWGHMLRWPLARLLRSPREQDYTPGIIFDTATTGPCTEAAVARRP